MSEKQSEWRVVWYPTFLILGILCIFMGFAFLFDFLGLFVLRIICRDIFYFGMVYNVLFFFCRSSRYWEKRREQAKLNNINTAE